MSADCLVRVAGLSRYFGDIHAVKALSFELRRGEVLGFLGPNGAGKSTTMKMLCGALAPSAGTVEIDGHDLEIAPRMAKRRLGYLPEVPPLYRELTVDEYLRFCAQIRGVKDWRGAIRDAKRRCGLEDTGARLLHNLSKGYQQRAGIAQAILHRPAVIVLDEPTAGLDPLQIREIRELIRDLGEEHGVILSTHILPEVNSVCNRVQILRAGTMVLDTPLNSLAGSVGRAIIGLRRPPPDAQILAALPPEATVSAVEPLAGGRFRLTIGNSSRALEVVAHSAAQHDWGLFEMTPENDSLEEIFIALTCVDELSEAEPGEANTVRAQTH